MKTNAENLVCQSQQGVIHHPTMRPGNPYRVSTEGDVRVLPATGGITYNVRVGDSAYRFVSDHIEPCVSLKNPDPEENAALATFSCIGNTAVVVSGDAKGATGTVTGKHGGIEHLLIDFAKEDMDRMAIGDKILIRSRGQGLCIEEAPWITVMNLDPDLFQRMGVYLEGDTLCVPVAATVPPEFMGSGLGRNNAYTGDYDIMSTDQAQLVKYGLDKLRLGDFVLLENCDNRFGRSLREGASSIGVVVHGGSIVAGHGPGVTTVLSAEHGLKGVLSSKANLVHLI